MVPYLKGFHLTKEMWRGGQDADGWKLHEEDKDEAAANHRVADKLGKEHAHAPVDNLTSPVP
jgi:hypothetical protein